MTAARRESLFDPRGRVRSLVAACHPAYHFGAGKASFMISGGVTALWTLGKVFAAGP